MPNISRLKRATNSIEKITDWLSPSTDCTTLMSGYEPDISNVVIGSETIGIPRDLFSEFMSKHGASLGNARDFLVERLQKEVSAALDHH